MLVYVFSEGGVYKALAENGSLLEVADYYSYKIAREKLPMRKSLQGHQVEFVTKHWENPGVIAAMREYESVMGCDWGGRCK